MTEQQKAAEHYKQLPDGALVYVLRYPPKDLILYEAARNEALARIIERLSKE